MTIKPDGGWSVSNKVPWSAADSALHAEWVLSGRWERFSTLRGAVKTVLKNRHLRRDHVELFVDLLAQVRAMRATFIDGNWTSWSLALERFQSAALRLALAYHAPLVSRGKAFTQSQSRAGDASAAVRGARAQAAVRTEVAKLLSEGTSRRDWVAKIRARLEDQHELSKAQIHRILHKLGH